MPISNSPAPGSGSGPSFATSTPGATRPQLAPFAPAIPGHLDIEGTGINLNTPLPRQATAVIFGESGVGKTTFVTRWCPGPIFLLCFDQRSRSAVNRARAAGRTVAYKEVSFSRSILTLTNDECMAIGNTLIEEVFRLIDWAVNQSLAGNIRTICFDTCSEFGELVELAVRGRFDGGRKKDFGESKAQMNRICWELLQSLRRGNANAILLARSKELWRGNQPTGKMVHRCPEVIYEGCDFAGSLRPVKQAGGLSLGSGGLTSVSSPAEPSIQPHKKMVELEVTKAGENGDEEGRVYRFDNWDLVGGPFAYMASRQYSTPAQIVSVEEMSDEWMIANTKDAIAKHGEDE